MLNTHQTNRIIYVMSPSQGCENNVIKFVGDRMRHYFRCQFCIMSITCLHVSILTFVQYTYIDVIFIYTFRINDPDQQMKDNRCNFI